MDKEIINYVDTCLEMIGWNGLHVGPKPDYERVFSQITQQTKGGGDLWLDDWVSAARERNTEEVSTPSAWPNGAPFAIALTHDVDFATSTMPHIYFLRRLQRLLLGKGSRLKGLRGVLGSLYRILSDIPRRERYGDLADWMKFEEARGVRSTFFFLPYGDGGLHINDGDYRFEDKIHFDGKKVQISDAIKAISDAGWEIGLHGTIQSARINGLLAKQKRQLEEITRVPLVSVRQHYLTYDPALTPSLQAAAGFHFDSTHGFNAKWGFPSGTCHPYPLWDASLGRPSSMVELPMSIMEVSKGLHKAPNETISCLLGEAYGIMSEVERSCGVLVMNWHPHYWSLGLARQIYQDLVNEGLRRGAFIGTLRSVGERARARS